MRARFIRTQTFQMSISFRICVVFLDELREQQLQEWLNIGNVNEMREIHRHSFYTTTKLELLLTSSLMTS